MTGTQSSGVLREAASARPLHSRIVIVGAGATGTALLSAFVAAGLSVTSVWTRGPAGNYSDGVQAAASAQEAADSADIVFLTVPDKAIASVAESIEWHDRQTVVHCSGALGLEALASALRQGAAVASWHPLFTFPRGQKTLIPTGVHFAYTGPEATRDYFQALTKRLGGQLIDVSEEAKPAYHAAAVTACNFTVTLAAVATSLLKSIGIGGEEALTALLPLIRATVENLEKVGLPGALTGPVVRGDLDTIALHQQALESTAFASLYDVLSRATATVALMRPDLQVETRSLLEQVERGDMT